MTGERLKSLSLALASFVLLGTGAHAAAPVYLGARYARPELEPRSMLRAVEWRSDSSAPISDGAFRRAFGLTDRARGRTVRPDPLVDPLRRAVRDDLLASPEALDSLRLRARAREAAILVAREFGDETRAVFLETRRLDPVLLRINPECARGTTAAARAIRLDEVSRGDTRGPGPERSRWHWSLVNARNTPQRGRPPLPLRSRIENDTLDLSFCHENAHGMMYDLYGSTFSKIERPSRNGHKTGITTDRGLAWIEGFAEAFEALYGPANPLLDADEGEVDDADAEGAAATRADADADPDAGSHDLPDFQLARQEPIRRGDYVWKPGRVTGEVDLRSGLEMISTEGVVATFCYRLLVSKEIDDPFTKLCVVIAEVRPDDVIDVATGLIERFPDDAHSVARLFLDATGCATASEAAARAFALRASAPRDTARYEALRDTLVDAVVAAPERLAANVGPDLWVRGFRKVAPARAAIRCVCPECAHAREIEVARKARLRPDVLDHKEFRINLNLVSAATLRRLGWTRREAARFVSMRAKRGYFDTESPSLILLRVLGPDRFRTFRRRFGLGISETRIPELRPAPVP